MKPQRRGHGWGRVTSASRRQGWGKKGKTPLAVEVVEVVELGQKGETYPGCL